MRRFRTVEIETNLHHFQGVNRSSWLRKIGSNDVTLLFHASDWRAQIDERASERPPACGILCDRNTRVPTFQLLPSDNTVTRLCAHVKIKFLYKHGRYTAREKDQNVTWIKAGCAKRTGLRKGQQKYCTRRSATRKTIRFFPGRLLLFNAWNLLGKNPPVARVLSYWNSETKF